MAEGGDSEARLSVTTGKQISKQQVKVLEVFITEPKQWFDSNTVARNADVPGSTVRHLLLTFHKFGLLERAETFDGYRYRLSPSVEAQPYFARVQEAAEVMKT